VTNIAEAHVLAIENLLGPATAAGEAFFISNGEPIPFRAFCLAIWANFDHYPPFQVTIPKGLAWFAGLLAECATWFTGGHTTLSRGSVRDACQCGYSSIQKARMILGYNPRISLSEGLKIACEVSSNNAKSHGIADLFQDYKRRLQNGEPVPRP
jgi:sterol-4alpha-carboxylate 3-dehydrogenase (decarboxylating)